MIKDKISLADLHGCSQVQVSCQFHCLSVSWQFYAGLRSDLIAERKKKEDFVTKNISDFVAKIREQPFLVQMFSFQLYLV